MVVLCFVLALVLLAAALYLLWLDKKQKQLKQRRTENAPRADGGPAAPTRPAAFAPQQDEQPEAGREERPVERAEERADEKPDEKPEGAKRGRFGRLLSGFGQGSASRGGGVAAGAAAGAGAVGLGAAGMTRASAADAQAGEHGGSDVMGENSLHHADADTEAPFGQAVPQAPEEGSLAAIQQQWLDARAFTEVTLEDSPVAGERVDGLGAAQRVFTGTFRGCDSVVTFAGPRTFVSLSRPGPATTAFIMERASAAEDGTRDVTVEQMNLRSDDPAVDALLEDPRVVTALRGAPGEFQYCEFTESWGHTSLPEDAISHYDGSIVALHALVSAAAALPASRADSLDLASTDPGSAAAGRSEDAEAEASLNPPRVVDADEFEADIEDLGDDLEPATLDETAVPFEPRKPGRAGHLRLVKSAGEDSAGEDSAGDDAADTKPSAPGSTAAAAAGTAAAGVAGVGAAGAAGVASASGSSAEEDNERAEHAGSAESVEDAGGHDGVASDVMNDDSENGSDQVDSENGIYDATKIEPDPFESAMRSDAVPADRGDVAADFLPQRNPVPRPSRATSARFGDGEDMPALAEPSIGSHGGSDDEFKPLGATGEDPDESRESIAWEVRRFETARTEAPEAPAASTSAPESPSAPESVDTDEVQAPGADGNSKSVASGEDSAEGEAQAAARPAAHATTAAPAKPAFPNVPRVAGSGGGRHRRADDDDDNEEKEDKEDNGSTVADNSVDNGASPRIRGNALDPDFVETTKFRAPNHRGGSHRSGRHDGES